MTLCLDTSALAKRYLAEPGSDQVKELWNSPEILSISVIGYAESLSLFHRHRREGHLVQPRLQEVLDMFEGDWSELEAIEVSIDVNLHVPLLLQRHPLKGSDAIHLATALLLRDRGATVSFVCADRPLLAAEAEGMATIPVGVADSERRP